MKVEIDIEDAEIPDGYECVRIGRVRNGELYMYGVTVRTRCEGDLIDPRNSVIVRKTFAPQPAKIKPGTWIVWHDKFWWMSAESPRRHNNYEWSLRGEAAVLQTTFIEIKLPENKQPFQIPE